MSKATDAPPTSHDVDGHANSKCTVTSSDADADES